MPRRPRWCKKLASFEANPRPLRAGNCHAGRAAIVKLEQLLHHRGDQSDWGSDMLIGSCHCGKASWTLEGDPGSVTACNCTLCRRYGTLWAYDYDGERITVSGITASYARSDRGNPTLEILFCPSCACVLSWRGLRLDENGRRRMAVNLRLAPPEEVCDLPIDHFDGLDTWQDLPAKGRCVRDLWF